MYPVILPSVADMDPLLVPRWVRGVTRADPAPLATEASEDVADADRGTWPFIVFTGVDVRPSTGPWSSSSSSGSATEASSDLDDEETRESSFGDGRPLTEIPLAATGVLKNERSISDRVELTRFFCSGESESSRDLRFEDRDVGTGDRLVVEIEAWSLTSEGSADSSIVLAKKGDGPVVE